MNLLNENNPVGFGYNPQILTHAYTLEKEEYEKYQAGFHASVITGKRVRNNSCQFLVQNSFGNYCKNYFWECQKDSRGYEIGVWVDAVDLITYSRDIFYIKDKGHKCKVRAVNKKY